MFPDQPATTPPIRPLGGARGVATIRLGFLPQKSERPGARRAPPAPERLLEELERARISIEVHAEQFSRGMGQREFETLRFELIHLVAECNAIHRARSEFSPAQDLPQAPSRLAARLESLSARCDGLVALVRRALKRLPEADSIRLRHLLPKLRHLARAMPRPRPRRALMIQPSAVNEFGCIEWPKLELVQLDIEQPLGHHSLLPGSVLICLRGSLRVCRIPNRIPQLGPPAGDPVPILASTAWAVIEPNPDEVTSEYLEWILNRPSVLKQLADRRKGSTVQFIPIKQLADIELPVPDLTTQREIVKTASDLDEARISGTSQHSRASIGHRMMPIREMLDSSWQSAEESRWSQRKSWEPLWAAQDPATPPPSLDLGEGTALYSVLDHYGLLNRVDFRERDAVMRLPDGRCILIDCSAPIDAMLAETAGVEPFRLKHPFSKQGSAFCRYIENLARRVNEEGEANIAWTVVYVPNAALLSRALALDPQIQREAVRNRISLSDEHALGPALSQVLTLASRPTARQPARLPATPRPATPEPAVRWPPPRR